MEPVKKNKTEVLNSNDLIVPKSNNDIINIEFRNFVSRYASYKDLVFNIHHATIDFNNLFKSDLKSTNDIVIYNKYKELINLVKYLYKL